MYVFFGDRLSHNFFYLLRGIIIEASAMLMAMLISLPNRLQTDFIVAYFRYTHFLMAMS